MNILNALDDVASRHSAQPAEIALAWLMLREGVTTAIASATKLEHVESFAKAASLSLSAKDTLDLDQASISEHVA
ncbi:aldo/keto reductase [Pseudorhodoplanes sp.]|uniref:aldo/keto reductase n=1 Tax=Pseudorhodoplanes sp. TaxID=1934341 RepID=UPI003D0F25DC